MPAKVIDSDYQGEIGRHQNGGKEKYVRKTKGPLGHLLVSTCPLIKVNGTATTQSR